MIFSKPGNEASRSQINNYLALPGIAMYASGQTPFLNNQGRNTGSYNMGYSFFFTVTSIEL
jgi:hypothetical protein